MLISGETARYELTHLNQYGLQKPRILPLGAERDKSRVAIKFCVFDVYSRA